MNVLLRVTSKSFILVLWFLNVFFITKREICTALTVTPPPSSVKLSSQAFLFLLLSITPFVMSVCGGN